MIEAANANDIGFIVDCWNARRAMPDSIWKFSPEATPDIIQRHLDSASVVVCRPEAGFGIWQGPTLIGIAANNKATFLKIVRFICLDQAGQHAVLMTSGANSVELEWLQEIGAELEFTVVGYKPLTDEQCHRRTKEELRTLRKPWLRRMTAAFDQVRDRIDAFQGGQ